MKNLKRIIAAFLTCAMLAGMPVWGAVSASAAEEPALSTSVPEGQFPSRFDLRDRGVVTPVKDQNPWGSCWAFSAIAAAETSILTAMGSTYADTGLDLSERHLAWYVTQPVTENISASQAGEGLHIYNTAAGPNHVFDFGGKEYCAATLFAQGIGPASEQDYPNRGSAGKLAFEDLSANKESFINIQIEKLRESYRYLDDETLRIYAEGDYEDNLAHFAKWDAYSPLDDWSILEPDEPGSGKLRGSSYTLTDNNVFNYWERVSDIEEHNPDVKYDKEPLYSLDENTINLYQESIDLIKAELYKGHGVSMGFEMDSDKINYDTWAVYSREFSVPNHVVCIVGWDDDYPASNFTHTTDANGDPLYPWDDGEEAAADTTPPGNGAWIVKNSWGSQTDAIPGGLTAADGTTKNANESDWGIVDENGMHTGYFYLSYYDATIGVPESYEFRPEANNDQQDALQLDYMPTSVTEWFHADESPMWQANIFTLDKNMRIDEVATRIRMTDNTPIAGFTVRFDLYKLYEGATKPDDGELISTATRTFENQGYHRTSLDTPVYLKAGDRLGIVVQQSHTFDDGTTMYCAEAQESDVYRDIPITPVYGTPVVNEGESFWKVTGLTEQEETAQDGWFDVTAPLSKEMLVYLKPDLLLNPFLAEFYFSRYCGDPFRDFFNIDNFCIKAFGEPYGLEHVEAAEGCPEHWVDPESGAIYADENGRTRLYPVTVNCGTADQKLFKAGDTVTVRGLQLPFREWIVTEGQVDLKDGRSPVTSFVMPEENVSLTALLQRPSEWSWVYNRLPKAASALPFTDVPRSDRFYSDIVYVFENQIMNGVSDTLFDPSGTLTRAMVVTILHRLEGEPKAAYSGAFTDVPDGTWYTDGVEWAAANGIVNGYGGGRFGPADAVTREQLAAILWRYAGFKGYATAVDENTNFLRYTDALEIADYAKQPMCWAIGNDMILDTNGDLRHAEPALRREVAAAIHAFHVNVAK